MFAVPGWSLSAATLKTQIDPKAHDSANGKTPSKQNGDRPGAEKKPKKRKRNKNVEVTRENLSELWQKYVGEKNRSAVIGVDQTEDRQTRKKRKRSGEDVQTSNAGAVSDTFEGLSDNIDAAAIEQPENGNNLLSETHSTPKNGQPATSKDRDQRKDGKALKDENKARFEQRKAEATKKREENATRRANGTLPPSRPEPNPSRDVAVPEDPQKTKTHSPSPSPPTAPGKADTKKELKVEKRKKRRLHQEAQDISNNPTSNSEPKAPPKLTPLQAQMAAKLTSARFRHLNQTLYTTPSSSAFELFAKTPQAYESYHAGFRAQVAVWPSNPVTSFIEDVKSRGKVVVPSQKKMWRDQKRGKGKTSIDGENVSDGKLKLDPLPRGRDGVCKIVDLGCGDATLAASLSSVKKALKIDIQSFDLAMGDSPNKGLITVADSTDLAKAGVRDGSVDVAVCCLSLMGTNWVGVVDECRRVLRGAGEVWVAEIKSRFGRPVKKGGKIGEMKGGGKEKGKGKKRKRGGAEGDDEGNEEAIALEELEEVRPAADETDVAAFVEVFRKRGFALKGDPDLSNKMFVKMRFVRGVRQSGDAGGPRMDRSVGTQGKLKFLGGKEEEGEEFDESKVLKPCVYKIR